MNWCVAEFNFEHEPSRSEVITHTAILSGNKNLNSVRMNKTLPSPLPPSLSRPNPRPYSVSHTSQLSVTFQECKH